METQTTNYQVGFRVNPPNNLDGCTKAPTLDPEPQTLNPQNPKKLKHRGNHRKPNQNPRPHSKISASLMQLSIFAAQGRCTWGGSSSLTLRRSRVPYTKARKPLQDLPRPPNYPLF